jgi:hypothetical protein
MEEVFSSSKETLLALLRSAGAAGLTVPALAKGALPSGGAGGKKPRQSKQAKAEAEASLRRRLADLEGSGQVLNAGTPKTPRYLLPEFDRRLELTCAALEAKATPGRATVYNLAALRRAKPRGATNEIVDEAVQRLLGERKLIAIQPGKSVFYLHSRSVAPMLPTDLAGDAPIRPSATQTAQTPPDVFSAEAVREAYAALVREGGFADVPIADLHQRSGVALTRLQAWLLEQSRAGRAAPSRGDWSLAGTAARDAAIEVRGEPHLQVRLL